MEPVQFVGDEGALHVCEAALEGFLGDDAAAIFGREDEPGVIALDDGLAAFPCEALVWLEFAHDRVEVQAHRAPGDDGLGADAAIHGVGDADILGSRIPIRPSLDIGDDFPDDFWRSLDFDFVVNEECRFCRLELGRPADLFGDRTGHGALCGAPRGGGGAGGETKDGQKRHSKVADDGADAAYVQHTCEIQAGYLWIASVKFFCRIPA